MRSTQESIICSFARLPALYVFRHLRLLNNPKNTHAYLDFKENESGSLPQAFARFVRPYPFYPVSISRTSRWRDLWHWHILPSDIHDVHVFHSSTQESCSGELGF